MHAQRQARLDNASRYKGALNNLKNNLSSGTDVEQFGPGSEAFADYGLFVKKVYDEAWIAPGDGADDSASVEVKVTIARAGQVLSAQIIKRSGINVSPAEVEEVLQQHADVGLAGVTGLADPLKGEIIVAFVVARAGKTVDAADLTAHCREKLSRYKIPDRIEVCEGLPLTPTGKLMRRELKALAGK